MRIRVDIRRVHAHACDSRKLKSLSESYKSIGYRDLINRLKNKYIRKTKQDKMVEIQNNSSVYGAQPRSLNIHWMKYDVTDENVNPNTNQSSPKQLSPLRQKL